MIINKKKVKLILIFILLMVIAFSFKPSNAALSPGDLAGPITNGGEIKPILATVLEIAGIIASAMSIITIILLGIKYMLGSIEEKAEYKKSLFPYIIGASFVFGATSIASIIYKAVK